MIRSRVPVATLLTVFAFTFAASFTCAQKQSAAAVDPLVSGFAHPPASAKLRCYWWWLNGNTNEQTITRDLEQMKAKGYGGAILVDANGSNQNGNDNVPAGPMFGTPAWTRLYLHALKEAARLHLEISLNIMSGWNLGGPYVKPEEASKLLTWSRTQIRGGSRIQQQLAAPQERNGFYREVAVLAYPLRHGDSLPGGPGSDRKPLRSLMYKSAARETGFSMPDSTPLLQDAPSTPGEQDTDIAQVQDISKYVSEDGKLDWEAPEGDWEILRIGYTDSDARVSTSSGDWQGLAIDYMDHRAFDAYWARSVDPLLRAAKPYIGSSLKYLVTDSWELGGTNWTGDFREQFKKLRGYDPVSWLPVIAGRIVESRDASNRFLADLRGTVADLIVTEHYDAFAEHARAWGLGIHPESGGPHGAPIDALETFRSAAFPQTEYWAQSATHRTRDDERFFVKESSSAAHIYGKTLVAQEGMTSIGPQWSESLAADLKPSFDQALTEGMNRLIWHEFTSSPASAGLPGQEYFAGTHLNPNVTWWSQAGAFLEYLNRCQFLLQQGQPVMDALYFYGDQVPNFVRLKADDPAHVLPGYDYDVTDEDALLHSLRIEGGQLLSPGGIRYRMLAMPASGRMSLPALQRIAEYVRGGGTVMGPKPVSPTGKVSSTDASSFKELTDEIWGDCSQTEHHAGKGMAYCSTNGHAVLEQMRVAPDVAAEGNAHLDFVHRHVGERDVFFVRNGSAQPVSTMAVFRVTGKQPELWDPVSGRTSSEYFYDELSSPGVTRLPLRLPSYGSVFVVFHSKSAAHITALSRNGATVVPATSGSAEGPVVSLSHGTLCLQTKEPGDYDATLSNGAKLHLEVKEDAASHPLNQGWTLSFEPGRGGPVEPIKISELTDWSRSSDPAIRYFSGTGTYATHFTFAPQSSEASVLLQLTHLYQICTVRVNGVEAGTIWAAPYQLDITRFLRHGDNRLDIAVTNLWPNRIIGDLQPGVAKHYTHTNIRAYNTDSPLLPSGLDGPVTLVTVQPHPLQAKRF